MHLESDFSESPVRDTQQHSNDNMVTSPKERDSESPPSYCLFLSYSNRNTCVNMRGNLAESAIQSTKDKSINSQIWSLCMKGLAVNTDFTQT